MTHIASAHAPVVAPVSRGQPRRNPVHWLVAPALTHKHTLVGLNVLYFGTCVIAAIFGLTNPAFQA
jgi:hypothetical protein